MQMEYLTALAPKHRYRNVYVHACRQAHMHIYKSNGVDTAMHDTKYIETLNWLPERVELVGTDTRTYIYYRVILVFP